MDSIYLIIVIILLALAVLDLVVGVSNDAVNFLNSSIGSKVAPLWAIFTVASVGVLIGTLFSSGMMEIARSGVFYPEKFTFPAIMMLFLAVMITDVVLLGLFLMWGGKIAIAAMVILVVFILHKSGRLHTKRKDKELQQQQILSTEAELVTATNKEVHRVMEKTLSICRRTIEGLKNEDRKVSKKAMVEANELYEKFKDKRDYEVVPTLESIQVNALEVEQEYVQLVDYSYEITKALKAMTEATFR